MPWFTVDDRFHNNAKTALVLGAGERGRAAIGLWTVAGAWCMDELTDGFVPAAKVLQLGWRKGHAELLVKAGLWHTAEGGYRFHQWLQRNPSKEQVLHQRAETKRRVQEHRDRHRNGVSNPRQQRLLDTNVTPIRNGATNGRSQIPDPRSQIDQERKRVEDLDPPDPRARTRENEDSRLVLDPDSDGRVGPMLEAFERIVHGGKRVGDRERCLSLLGDLFPAVADRAPDDPVGLFERVLERYTADRRARSKTPTVELFARDFAAWAQREIDRPNSPGARADRLKGLKAALRDARRRWRAATNDDERSAANSALADAERELVSAGVLPDEVDDDDKAAAQ